MLICSHFVINIFPTVPQPEMGARSKSSEVISVSCGSSVNQLVFCDTVNSEKFRDVKLKHFYTSLVCLPVIFELPSKLWLQSFPVLKTLSALKEDRWKKYLAMPETWTLFRAGWKMETKIYQQSIQQRACPFKVKSFILWVGHPGFFTGWGECL